MAAPMVVAAPSTLNINSYLLFHDPQVPLTDRGSLSVQNAGITRKFLGQVTISKTQRLGSYKTYHRNYLKIVKSIF